MPSTTGSGTRVPFSRARAGLTPEVIAGAALEIVREHGFAGLTMRRLADALGVRAPSLYQQIESKDALLALVAHRVYTTRVYDPGTFDRAGTVDDFVAAFRDGARRIRRFYLDHPGLAAVILAHVRSARDLEPGARGDAVHAEVEAMVRLGVSREAARRRYETNVRWILGAILVEDLPHGDPEDDEARFEAGLATFLDGERLQLTVLATPG